MYGLDTSLWARKITYEFSWPLWRCKSHTSLLYRDLRFITSVDFNLGLIFSFGGTTGTVCFKLGITLLMSFKARVNSPTPVLFTHLHVIILRPNWDLIQGFLACRVRTVLPCQAYIFYSALIGVLGEDSLYWWRGYPQKSKILEG